MSFTPRFAFTTANFNSAIGTTKTTLSESSGANSVAVGDTVIAWVTYSKSGDTTIALADDLSNSLAEIAGAKVFSSSGNNFGIRCFWYKVPSGAAGVRTLTATPGAAAGGLGIFAYCYSGLKASPVGPLAAGRAIASVANGTDGIVSNSLTLTGTDVPAVEIGFLMFTSGPSGGSTFTAGTGFTTRVAADRTSNPGTNSNKFIDKRITASGSYTSTFTTSNASGNSCLVGNVTFLEQNADPLITGTDVAAPLEGANLIIQGQNFGASQGASTLTVGGVAPTINSWGDTAISVVANANNSFYNSNLTISLTVGGVTTTYTVQIAPPSGWSAVILGTLAGSTNRLTAVTDLATGYQVAWDNKSGTVTVYTDASFNSTIAQSFGAKANNGVGWGTVGTQTISSGPSITISGTISLPLR